MTAAVLGEKHAIVHEGVEQIEPFFGPILLLLFSTTRPFLITLSHMIFEKATLTILVLGVSRSYHEENKFFVRQLKLHMLVDLGLLMTNIIMRVNKTLTFYKWFCTPDFLSSRPSSNDRPLKFNEKHVL